MYKLWQRKSNDKEFRRLKEKRGRGADFLILFCGL